MIIKETDFVRINTHVQFEIVVRNTLIECTMDDYRLTTDVRDVTRDAYIVAVHTLTESPWLTASDELIFDKSIPVVYHIFDTLADALHEAQDIIHAKLHEDVRVQS